MKSFFLSAELKERNELMISKGHKIMDAHAHMCDPIFDMDRAQVLKKARAAGINAIV